MKTKTFSILGVAFSLIIFFICVSSTTLNTQPQPPLGAGAQ